ncbi:hypothetical protein PAPYR_7679 [Paratrimastix pyriformis]|uniref:Uncharacterized protein n=1 Tax=Paratrimastix pyriformis TaxID=342808 RepID=A0ABQ8UCG3_9EUKA|nr:hypothetical protein PAPYR_7679 [Paratrimastix pyriformis]
MLPGRRVNQLTLPPSGGLQPSDPCFAGITTPAKKISARIAHVGPEGQIQKKKKGLSTNPTRAKTLAHQQADGERNPESKLETIQSPKIQP